MGKEHGFGDTLLIGLGRSCREWRQTHSIEASSISWGRRSRRGQKHRIYHLQDRSLSDIRFERIFSLFTHVLRRPVSSQLPSKEVGFERTTGSRLDHASNSESLDYLVLGRVSGEIGASDGLDVVVRRMANLLMALSLGVRREQLEPRMALSLGVRREQLEPRMGLTWSWPRRLLLRPLLEIAGQMATRRKSLKPSALTWTLAS